MRSYEPKEIDKTGFSEEAKGVKSEKCRQKSEKIKLLMKEDQKQKSKVPTKNDLRIESMNKYAKDNYQEEIDRLTLDNVAYCTRLYALVRYFESYFDVYIQNRKEIENLTAKILIESTTVPARINSH